MDMIKDLRIFAKERLDDELQKQLNSRFIEDTHHVRY